MNVPHLLQLLSNEYYADQLKKGANETQARKMVETAVPFLEYARDYLTKNRPSTISHTESNYLLNLTNGKTASVCPIVNETKGTMQASTAVPVSGVAAEIQSVVDSGYIAVGHQPHTPAQTAQQFTMIEGVIDRTVLGPMIDFTRPDARLPR